MRALLTQGPCLADQERCLVSDHVAPQREGIGAPDLWRGGRWRQKSLRLQFVSAAPARMAPTEPRSSPSRPIPVFFMLDPGACFPKGEDIAAVPKKEKQTGRRRAWTASAPQSLWVLLPSTDPGKTPVLSELLQQALAQGPYRFSNNRLKAQIPAFSSQKMSSGGFGAP